MSFTLGIEGDLPSGDHSWDVVALYGPLGQPRQPARLDAAHHATATSWRRRTSGANATFDPNPWEIGGFAESTPTCTSGLPVADDRDVTADCLQMISPALKNVREMTQTILEANLVGDLAEMKAGPLQYALGSAYRENSFNFVPDNLSDIQNEVDPIAGLFPNEASGGEFDVAEIYGELLDPDHLGRPDGRRAFQRRARRPRLGLEHGADAQPRDLQGVDRLGHHAALSNPRRLQPRVPRAELGRAVHQAHAGVRRLRHARLVLDEPRRLPAASARRRWSPGAGSAAQVAQTLAICRALMGAEGAAFYYDPARTQDTVGGTGVSKRSATRTCARSRPTR